MRSVHIFTAHVLSSEYIHYVHTSVASKCCTAVSVTKTAHILLASGIQNPTAAGGTGGKGTC